MRIIQLLLLSLALCSCSVVAASSGTKEPDFSKIAVGSSRAEVEAELGEPYESKSVAGGTEAVYIYKIGDKPAAGRALGYLVLDIFTICLAEYILFPMEISNSGNAYEALVQYDSSGKAKKIVEKRETEKDTEKN